VEVNLGISAQNSSDWDRILSGNYAEPPATPDWKCVEGAMAVADLAEPLGFDGIWAPEHFGTPYGMCPNPLQALAYYAGKTEGVSLGTMVAVAPWWHPIRLAHRIAYLDIISKGRFKTVGLGRGVAKSEFDTLGIPREQARERFSETLDILKLAFTQERFSYEGEVFKIPETSLRPMPYSSDLFDRIYGSAASKESLEILARRGFTPLFVGNKPIEDAGQEVLQVNTFRAEEGYGPCQPKNVLMIYCVPDKGGEERADEWLLMANRDVNVHYGFADPSNFIGVAGYESYPNRQASATAVLDEVAGSKLLAGKDKPKQPGYHPSNLMFGTPDQVYDRIVAAQRACSFSEITVLPNFGTMPYDEALRSTRLFAQEVLPALHKLDAKLHPKVCPASPLSKARDGAVSLN
jgi:alkanesulfonate monooxygenase SsuD/methylene tetrahydromethanopterin reductase-like flavin-dependent oxidoreductase (luciferase family)